MPPPRASSPVLTATVGCRTTGSVVEQRSTPRRSRRTANTRARHGSAPWSKSSSTDMRDTPLEW
jgi:hypothetical protein